MAYPPRICLPDVLYHVKSDCHNFQPLLALPEACKAFDEALKVTLEGCNFIHHGHRVTPDSFEMFITTLSDGETISDIMKLFKSQLTKRFNKLMGSSGTLWNRRFEDEIINVENHGLHVHNLMEKFRKKTNTQQISLDKCRLVPIGWGAFCLDGHCMGPLELIYHKYHMRLGHYVRDWIKGLLICVMNQLYLRQCAVLK